MKSFLIATMLTVTSLIATPQAIIFDFGGVLTGQPNREAVITFICESFGFSSKEFEQVNHMKRLAIQQGITDEDFWISYAADHSIELVPDWIKAFKAVQKEAIGLNPNMYRLVDQLKEQQIPVGMLSNIDERLAKLLRDFGLYEPFEPCLLSYQFGIEKPDLRIYELLLNTLSLPAAQIVFIDDKLENIEAAKMIGIDAVLFESEQQIREALRMRGALV